MIGSRDMEGDRQNFFFIFGNFLLLYLTKNPKNKNFEKKKKKNYIIILNLYITNYIKWCMLPEIWSATNNFLSFWGIFYSFALLNNPEN